MIQRLHSCVEETKFRRLAYVEIAAYVVGYAVVGLGDGTEGLRGLESRRSFACANVRNVDRGVLERSASAR